MSIRRCELCRYAINQPDHVICALIPPTPLVSAEADDKEVMRAVIRWVRPSMVLAGFCGQFRLSIWKLFGGSRA